MSLFSYANDRVLWFIVVGTLATACYVIPSHLQHLKAITEAPSRPTSDDVKKDEPQEENTDEENLRPSTLRGLYNGTSPDIRSDVIKIVATRITRPETRKAILQDLASQNPHKRDRAIKALHLVCFNPYGRVIDVRTCFDQGEIFAALATALCNLLPLHERPKPGDDLPPSPIYPLKRPAQERALLSILDFWLSAPDSVLPGGRNKMMHAVIHSGLISLWLVNYPFPCALRPTQTTRKSSVYGLFIDENGDPNSWYSDDPAMGRVFLTLKKIPEIRKLLWHMGLDVPPIKPRPRGVDAAQETHCDNPYCASCNERGLTHVPTTEAEYEEWASHVISAASQNTHYLDTLLTGASVTVEQRPGFSYVLDPDHDEGHEETASDHEWAIQRDRTPAPRRLRYAPSARFTETFHSVYGSGELDTHPTHERLPIALRLARDSEREYLANQEHMPIAQDREATTTEGWSLLSPTTTTTTTNHLGNLTDWPELHPPSTENDVDHDTDADVPMHDAADAAVVYLDAATGVAHVPPRNNRASAVRRERGSAAEEQLRRRHREAVVVAERGERLGRGNILEPLLSNGSNGGGGRDGGGSHVRMNGVGAGTGAGAATQDAD